MSRRIFLAHWTAILLLTACGGGGDQAPIGVAPVPLPPSQSPPLAPPVWTVNLPSMAAGSGQTFDLATTLPSGVARNGTFGVNASGARLPAGMTLSSLGILAVGSATVGEVRGVVFTYETP